MLCYESCYCCCVLPVVVTCFVLVLDKHRIKEKKKKKTFFVGVLLAVISGYHFKYILFLICWQS